MRSAQDIAAYLGTTRQTVNNRRKSGQFIALSREVGGLVYPQDQFIESTAGRGVTRPPHVVPGLDHVIKEMGNGWETWIWLTNPRDDLGGATPLARLRSGDTRPVYDALASDVHGDFG